MGMTVKGYRIPAGRSYVYMKRIAWLLIPTVVASLAGSAAAAPVTSNYTPPKPYVLASQHETQIAQGLTLTAFNRLYTWGWARGWLLRAELSHPTLSTDVITGPGILDLEPISQMASREGAIAAVNGDFFAMAGSGIALGTVVKGGEYLQSPQPGWPNGVALGQDNLGRLASLALEGTVTLPGGAYVLQSVNVPIVPKNGIGLFTPMWTTDRSLALADVAQGCEVVVRNGIVVSVSPVVTRQPVPEDGYVLVGREGGAAPLAQLKVGDPVSLSYRPSPNARWAIGGYHYLVDEGQVVPGLEDSGRRPRTAIGFTADSKELLLLTVEGDTARSSGLTIRELAEAMRSFGAVYAMELDGGGSSTMVARLPGTEGLSVLNGLAGGTERKVPNGVGVFAPQGSGVAQHLEVQGEQRVFAGLSRRLSVLGMDEQYGPAEVADPAWRLTGPGAITEDGVYKAPVSGGTTAIISASARPVPPQANPVTEAEVLPDEADEPVPESVSGATYIKVLGPLARIEAEVGDGLRLTEGTGALLAVTGYDSDGFKASVDPADLELTYDPELLRFEREGDALRVLPLKEGAGLLTVSVQGHRLVIPFASAVATSELDAFEEVQRWRFESYPAAVSGAVSSAPGRSGNSVALTYTFGAIPSNRAAYLQAAEPLTLPGQPRRVGMWVKGDGQGAWLRAVLKDANDTSYTVDLARHVDWTDWKYVEAEVPAGVAYPVRLHRVYPVETDAQKQYTGTLLFDDLAVKSAVALPPAPPAEEAPASDPILRAAPAGPGSWSFAVVGGAPDLGAIMPPESAAALVIGRAMEADPKFFLLDTSRTTPEMEALLRGFAGDRPVYTIEPPTRYVDVNGVRFILLGTGTSGVRSADFEQFTGLQALLALAQADAKVRQLVVVGNTTPLSFRDSQEGELIRRWLTEWEERSGKSAVFLGAGGTETSVTRVEGIPIIEAGSMKRPKVVTIDPTPGNAWIRLEP